MLPWKTLHARNRVIFAMAAAERGGVAQLLLAWTNMYAGEPEEYAEFNA